MRVTGHTGRNAHVQAGCACASSMRVRELRRRVKRHLIIALATVTAGFSSVPEAKKKLGVYGFDITGGST